MKYKQEFQTMLDTWGEESQLDMCIEEMAELTKALCKYKRLRKNQETDAEKIKKNLENVQEEIADVLNCASQMANLFGEEEINRICSEKIARTMKKMNSLSL